MGHKNSISLRKGSDHLIAQSASLLRLKTHKLPAVLFLYGSLIGSNGGLVVNIFYIHFDFFSNGTFLLLGLPVHPMLQIGVHEVTYAQLLMSV